MVECPRGRYTGLLPDAGKNPHHPEEGTVRSPARLGPGQARIIQDLQGEGSELSDMGLAYK